MAHKKFDASLKDIIEAHAADWAALLGAAPIRGVRVIDAEVSTVSAAADKAMVIDDGGPEWILHPELESGRDLSLPRNVWWYNSVFHRRHGCLVRSVVLLLRRVADGPELSGEYNLQFPDDVAAYSIFRYRVLRLWQLSAERLLKGGIGTLPLAPLTDDAVSALPDVVARIDRRLTAEAPQDEADKLRAATTVLMGLRHSPDVIDSVLQGVSAMWEKVYEDSSIVQRSMQRAERLGAMAHARTQLLRLGHAKFGPPSSTHLGAINAIADLDQLDALGERLLTVNSWGELLTMSS